MCRLVCCSADDNRSEGNDAIVSSSSSPVSSIRVEFNLQLSIISTVLLLRSGYAMRCRMVPSPPPVVRSVLDTGIENGSTPYGTSTTTTVTVTTVAGTNIHRHVARDRMIGGSFYHSAKTRRSVAVHTRDSIPWD